MNVFTEYMFLRKLSANTNTPVKTTGMRHFTKLSWDTEVKGVKFTVEAIKLKRHDSYYAQVIYDGQPIHKITPRTPNMGAIAQDMFKNAQIVAKRQMAMARAR